MSFEDNMIDDGFSNEMDYMDYLMAKACEDDNDDFEGGYHHEDDD